MKHILKWALVLFVIACYHPTANASVATYSNGVLSIIPGTDTPAINNNDVGNGINNAGSVVGQLYLGGVAYAGFVYAGGTLTALLPFGAPSAQAFGINDVGEVIGVYRPSFSSPFEGTFLFSNGAFTNFVYPFASDTTGTTGLAINDSGEIVGLYSTSNFQVHSFVYSAGSFTPLPDVPGSILTSARGLNDTGQIVGFYEPAPAGSSPVRGFLYSGGAYSTIQFPGAFSTYPNDINNLGQIAGTYYDLVGGSLQGHSFLYSNGVYTNLDSLPIQGIAAINDAGTLLGTYVPPSPGIPEPNSSLLIGFGLCALLRRAVRARFTA